MKKLVDGRFIESVTPKAPSLPTVPPNGDQAQRRFNEAVREVLGRMFTGETRFATATEVPSLAAPTPGTTEGQTPPAPTGLTATGAFENIILAWDYPDYDYHGYTRIFRNTIDDFTTAVVIANTEGKVWADPVGTNASFYYWVANVSVDGVQGPPNAVAGTLGQTAPNVNFLLDTLAGQILASSLNADLAARIDLIDGSMAGSVNARIASEATTRADADGAMTSRVDTMQTTYDGQIASIQTVNTTQGDQITGLRAQYTVKVDVNGRVAGIGLASDSTSSQIQMLADKFAIVIPGVAGGAPQVPFVATTINGVAAVGISTAFIGNLTADKITSGTFAADRIAAASIDASKLNVSTLSSVSANIGLLRTASSGARMEIENNQLRVYDSAGTLRVRLGIW